MSTLETRITRGEDGTLAVDMSGTIDETTDLAAAFAQIDADCTLELGGLERINSMGIHRWIPLMTSLTSARLVRVARVSYAMVMQANAVANLFAGAEVLSCIAPYFCAQCHDDRSELVTRQDLVASGGAPPERTCAACRGTLEFDELDDYFYFFRLGPSP